MFAAWNDRGLMVLLEISAWPGLARRARRFMALEIWILALRGGFQEYKAVITLPQTGANSQVIVAEMVDW